MKKRTKQWMTYPVVAALLVNQVACSGAGMGGSATDPDPAVSGEALNPTGQELFRGILMGEGRLAAKLPEMWNTPEYRDGLELAAKSKTTQELAGDLDKMRELFVELGLDEQEVAGIKQKADELRAAQVAPGSAAWINYANPEVTTAITTLIEKKSPGFFASFKSDVESNDVLRVQSAVVRGIEQLGTTLRLPKMASDPGIDCGFVFIWAAAAYWVAVAAATLAANATAVYNISAVVDIYAAWVEITWPNVNRKGTPSAAGARMSATIAERFAR